MDKKLKLLNEKMIDYKRFATVLLMIAVFFYLGVIIPSSNKTDVYLFILMTATSLSLGGSMFFFTQSDNCKDKIAEYENN